MKYQYEQMLPSEFLQSVEKCPVFFVPLGLLEWHGDHLPLGLDGIKAHALCLDAARALGGGIVMPAQFVGRPGYSRYTGTLTYSEGLVSQMLYELYGQLKKVGAKVIVTLTGHYGPLQVDCVKRVSANFGQENPEIAMITQAEYEGVTVDGQAPADHAGKWETSMLWHYYPELCDMDKFCITPAPMSTYKSPANDYYKESDTWQFDEDLTLAASPELGKKCAHAVADHLAELVRQSLK